MQPTAKDTHSHAAHGEHHHHEPGFWSKYVFSTDHKIIGIQFLFSTLLWFLVGGLLALGIRWQLAWPWEEMPVTFGPEGAPEQPGCTKVAGMLDRMRAL